MSKDKKDLIVFGYGLGIIAATFAVGSVIKHGFSLAVIVLILCCVIFITVTLLNWQALKLGYQAWMKVAHLIGGVVTAIILSVIYFLIFTPISILLKLLGRDHLQRDFSKKNSTYWEKVDLEASVQQSYHQQF